MIYLTLGDESRVVDPRAPCAAKTQGLQIRLRIWIFVLSLFTAPWALAQAPDIPLRDLDGKPQNVGEFIGHGKWVVVMFWAYDCPICNREITAVNFFHEEHLEDDITVLGISIDGQAQRDKAIQFVRQHDVSFRNLLTEPDRHILQRFGGGPFVGTPTFYIYEPSGNLAAKQVGPLDMDVLEEFIQKQQEKAAARTLSE